MNKSKERRRTRSPEPKPEKRRRTSVLTFSASITVFLSVLLIYSAGENFPSFDTIWIPYTAMSIAREGNTDLDEYQPIMSHVRGASYSLESVNGHLYSIFPVGTAVLAAPLILAIDGISRIASPAALSETMKYAPPKSVELFLASFFVALAAVFVFLIANLSLDIRYALLVAFIFAFGSSSWSVASRALWQHGPSMLMLSIAFYLLVLGENSPAIVQYSSLPIAMSYVVRPTNSISVAAFTVFVFLRHREQFLRYMAWALAVAIPFTFFNLLVYKMFLSPYYLSKRVGLHHSFFEAIAGNLASPARGLFVYSPIFLFSLYGFFVKLRRKTLESLDIFLAVIPVIHLLAISSFPHWWAGWSFGPRFFTDMNPFFAYFLIPAISAIREMSGSRKVFALALFTAAAVFSLFVHYRGATNWGPYTWNYTPSSVDAHPERLWDWSDPQFLRFLDKNR